MKLVFFLKILIFNIRVKYHFRTFIENIITNKYLSMKTIHIRILIISFVILLAACTNKEKTNLQKERTDNFPSMNDASKANLSAGETYQTLLQSFRISRSQTDSIIYPSYYGGAYINSNNQLVILLSDTTKENKRSIENILGSGNFILKKCTFTYAYLKQIMNTVTKSYQENSQHPSIMQNISYIRFQEDKNCIVIGLLEFSEKRISEFRENISDSPAIKFEAASGYNSIESKFQLSPGTFVRNSKSIYQDRINTTASLGYRATMSDGSKGFVVSGHFLWEGGSLYYPITEEGPFEFIGSCVKSQTSGKIDAAFCTIDTDICDLLQIPHTNVHMIPVRSVPIGCIVRMHRDQYANTGKITSANVWVTFKNGTKIGEMYTADYTSEPRDSGSAIYVSTAHNESALVGIHQGRSTYNEAYIVQAQYINETFNISCY